MRAPHGCAKQALVSLAASAPVTQTKGVEVTGSVVGTKESVMVLSALLKQFLGAWRPPRERGMHRRRVTSYLSTAPSPTRGDVTAFAGADAKSKGGDTTFGEWLVAGRLKKGAPAGRRFGPLPCRRC